MPDERTKADKMRATANAASAAPAEREFATRWLTEHQEPLRAQPIREPDAVRQRREAREEAAYKREQAARLKREGYQFDADAFGPVADFMRDAQAGFAEGFREEGFFTRDRTTPMPPAYRAARAEEARLMREMQEDMMAGRRSVRAETNAAAASELRRRREERDAYHRAAAERKATDGKPHYRIDEDEAGNPIMRRKV